MSTGACTNVPIELIIATLDPVISKKQWGGVLYYGVTCGDETIPNTMIPIDKFPSVWNFCKSACPINTNTFSVYFTFKKNSKTAGDYIAFTFTRDAILQQGTNSIKDSAGKELKLYISELHLINDNTVELWISSVAQKETVITITNDTRIKNPTLAVLLTIFVLVIILGLSAYFYYSGIA